VTGDDIRTAVLASLASVAPEVDAERVPGDAELRQELDLDSMDFLNFVIGLHTRLGVDVPETDYAKLATVNKAAAYLASRLKV
jgi:acyl carrier protein